MVRGLVCTVVFFCAVRSGMCADPQGVQFFETKIRPVLVKHCYECHSSESDSLKGGLLVDSAAGLQTGGDSGPAIIGGKPEESVLLQALKYENYEMPPSGKLSVEVIHDFERWISMGAPDPRTETTAGMEEKAGIDFEEGRHFWAFQPVEPHVTPDVKQTNWPRHWIDRFILSRLEDAHITPQKDADRGTLLRRLSYDLTGLPPTPQDLQTYLYDEQPDAIENYVDRLLQSPQFGIQWGRHWLDVARYADSNGGDFNATFHNAWRYRNYIFNSYNEDRSYADLIVEQIAGDLLPAANDAVRERQLVATGFLMLGTKMLSERNKVKLQMDVVDDQISTVGTAFLGLTLGCARCHDHKFDPIPTKDYYALAGIMKSTQVLDGESQKYVSTWLKRPLPISPERAAALDEYEKQVNDLKKQQKRAEAEVRKKEVNGTRKIALQQGVIVDDADAELVGEWKSSTFSKDFIGPGYVHDDRQAKGKKQVIFRANLPASGKYEVRIAYAGISGRSTNTPVTISHLKGETTVKVDQSKLASISRILQPVGHYEFAKETPATVTISNRGTKGYVIVDAVQFVPVEKLKKRDTADSAPQLAELERAKSHLKEIKKSLKALKSHAPKPAPMALAVRDASDLGDCNLCIRGESGMLGPKVPRGFLTVAHFDETPVIEDDESGRLELAHWVADPRNPLTARVYVNRVWHHLFGEGIVRTVDNFGALGDRPTHPDLLDQLAVEFIAHQWSTKWLVRQIVLSHTYQLSSEYDAAGWAADPENKLLWRAHRKRVPAESIRDTMLMAAGQLDMQQTESPVANLGVLVTKNVASDTGFQVDVSNVRTVFQPVIRSELPSVLRVFDFADPDLVTGDRPQTNVPAQALWMLNGEFVSQQAEAVVDRAFQTELSTSSERIEQLTQLTMGRLPTIEESRIGQEFIEAALFEANNDEQVRQAWQDFVHALFASSAFRMID